MSGVGPGKREQRPTEAECWERFWDIAAEIAARQFQSQQERMES